MEWAGRRSWPAIGTMPGLGIRKVCTHFPRSKSGLAARDDRPGHPVLRCQDLRRSKNWNSREEACSLPSGRRTSILPTYQLEVAVSDRERIVRLGSVEPTLCGGRPIPGSAWRPSLLPSHSPTGRHPRPMHRSRRANLSDSHWQKDLDLASAWVREGPLPAKASARGIKKQIGELSVLSTRRNGGWPRSVPGSKRTPANSAVPHSASACSALRAAGVFRGATGP